MEQGATGNHTQGRPVRSRHALLAHAFEVFGRSFGPFVDERMSRHFPEELDWAAAAADRMGRSTELEATDPLFQLLVVRRFWGPVFADFFAQDLRGLVNELIEVRNRWAHLDLPEDAAYLERALLAIERLVAPVAPLEVTGLRRIRSGLRSSPSTTDHDHRDEGAALAAQLSETEAAFEALRDRHAEMVEQLEQARRAAAARQLHLATLERNLQALRNRSSSLEHAMAAERSRWDRVQWLLVGLIAVLLALMALAGA